MPARKAYCAPRLKQSDGARCPELPLLVGGRPLIILSGASAGLVAGGRTGQITEADWGVAKR